MCREVSYGGGIVAYLAVICVDIVDDSLFLQIGHGLVGVSEEFRVLLVEYECVFFGLSTRKLNIENLQLVRVSLDIGYCDKIVDYRKCGLLRKHTLDHVGIRVVRSNIGIAVNIGGQIIAGGTRFNGYRDVFEIFPRFGIGQRTVRTDKNILMRYRVGVREIDHLLPFIRHGETGGSDLESLALNCVDDGVEFHEVEVDVTIQNVGDGLPDVHIDSLIISGDGVIIRREIGIRRYLYRVLSSRLIMYDHIYFVEFLRMGGEVTVFFRIVSDAAVVSEDVVYDTHSHEVIHSPVGILEHLVVCLVDDESIFLYLVSRDFDIQDLQVRIFLGEGFRYEIIDHYDGYVVPLQTLYDIRVCVVRCHVLLVEDVYSQIISCGTGFDSYLMAEEFGIILGVGQGAVLENHCDLMGSRICV